MGKILGLTIFLVVGCFGQTIPQTKERRLAHASNDFAFDLLRSYRNEKNVFVSPFSISTALAMVYLGANGTTARDMRNVLKYDKYNLTEHEVHEAFHSLLEKANENDNDLQLSSFNSALFQKDYDILETYRNALEQFFSARIKTVDFAIEGESVKAEINQAVDNATKGKIKELLSEPPSSETKLFLLNAVYFLGSWEEPFRSEDTFEGTFYNNGVDEKRVQMMFLDDYFLYSQDRYLDASVVVLPYKGRKNASMIIVLPNERGGIGEVEQKINQEALNNALGSAYTRSLFFYMPKFSLTFSADLAEKLGNLGLGELFGNHANLSGIVGNESSLRVSKVLHKAVIDVNERGTEAAGATGIGLVPYSLSVSITVKINHPFLFFIRENINGTIWFSGRVDEL